MVRASLLLIPLAALALSGCGEETARRSAQSACTATDVALPEVNLSIDGAGFFVFMDSGELVYSRRGDLCVDRDGRMINGLGTPVQIYQETGTPGMFNQGNLVSAFLPLTSPSGGALSDVTVTTGGLLEAVFTAGSNLLIGKLAIARFYSPQNLQASDDAICRVTFASGVALRGEAGEGGFGTIQRALQGPVVCDQGRIDVRVSGEGLFVLNNAGTAHYGASLILGHDSDNRYIDEHGYRLAVYAADASGTIVPTVVDLAEAEVMPPVATTSIELAVNLDASAPLPANTVFSTDQADSFNFSLGLTVFDALGVSHATTFYFVKTSAAETWNLYGYLNEVPMSAGINAFQTLTFSGGALSSVPTVVYDPLEPPSGAAALVITVDLTGLTLASAPFAIAAAVQNGYAQGWTTATHILANGEIRLDYSNGIAGLLRAQLVLAQFPNPALLSLSADGETYLATPMAGAPTLDVAGSSGLGNITATEN